MAKKKILYVVTQGVLGGAQKYVLDLAVGLKHDFDCAIASGAGEGLSRAATEANIPYYRLTSLTREIRPFRDLLAMFEIAKLVRALKPDIVHLNSSKATVVGAFGAKLGGAKIVVSTMHGLVLLEPMPALKKAAYYLAEKLAAPFQNALIAVSKADRDAALKYRLKPADKIFVIRNGIDLKNLIFLPREQARAKLLAQLPPQVRNKKIVFALADHYAVKGLDVLAEAVALMKEQDDFVIINVRREGPATQNLQNKISKLGLQNRFLTLGLDDPAPLLKAADVFVLPSLKEGLPYALLYAAAAGLPIIASNTGGIPDVVKHNASALFTTPGNVEQLADAIRDLLNDPALSRNLAFAASKQSQRFDLEKMLQATKDLYEKLGP